MKKLIISSILVALLAGCSQTPYQAKIHPHWGYSGETDPQHWGELSVDYQLCERGKNQSPVNFTKAVTSYNSVKYQYQPSHISLVNNGHTLQASLQTENNQLKIDEKVFVLQQFHFHSPSEHQFQGNHFPVEIHFVHKSATGELAVLAVMVKEGNANPVLEELLHNPLNINEKKVLARPLDIIKLLPQSKGHYRLNGSLTTPPCSEGVNWVVLQQPINASSEQLQLFSRTLGHNNRPVQPMNARIVVSE
ncbi:carbonic anhydrase family protein [Avibacterium sp. 20-15]|uniref:carbonic anhydrase n=1 Tax=unclassified Avibacterium TaxID=2685287 RepID=UPI0020269306|nr:MULTISPECIES: carbonic anhydrase family protein [unclassified Avibacterium]MCW9732961.1 carbonic anhydrase family protein [Avibacterium sp. 20-15]URL05094.1 carbonic anhydrase family protein [Avibacterium sp. 20-132]